jgi:hypothetical protein
MTADSHEKVNAGHLKRNAYLYIRQSTLRQVLENTESTIRQYDLRQRAVALLPDRADHCDRHRPRSIRGNGGGSRRVSNW